MIRHQHTYPNSSGFSIIELLVVISIIALLAAMSVPVIDRHKIKVSRVEMYQNMTTIFTLLQSYHATNDTYPGLQYGQSHNNGAIFSDNCKPNSLGFSSGNCENMFFYYEVYAGGGFGNPNSGDPNRYFTIVAQNYTSEKNDVPFFRYGRPPINIKKCKKPSAAFSAYYNDRWIMTENREVLVAPHPTYNYDAIQNCT